MSQFPIDALLEQICSAVRPGQTVLLQAPPGAGKTTRVPLALIGAFTKGQGVLEEHQKIWMIEPRRLAMAKLWNYTRYMKEQGLQSADYMLAFWQKLLMPVATIGMVLIAISFIFGPLREVTMGLRMAAGIVAGLAFNYGQQFFGHLSLVFRTEPLMAAGLPPLLCLILGVWLLLRVR